MNHLHESTPPQKNLDYESRVEELIRAIANDLLKLGYTPSEKPGYVGYHGQESIRAVAREIWIAMIDIQNGGKV